MENMVNWNGDNCTDSGEGGLFAWMIVPENLSSGEAYGANTYGFNCHVDVAAYLSRPRLMLRSPDVCVSTERSKVYEPYQHRDSWFDHQMTLTKRLNFNLELDEDRKLKRAFMSTLGHDDISVPMLASVFLGSTSASLWDEQRSRYFEVGVDDLTANGKTVYDAMQRAYGVDPILLTFLDT
jgi:hypothetical protein